MSRRNLYIPLGYDANIDKNKTQAFPSLYNYEPNSDGRGHYISMYSVWNKVLPVEICFEDLCIRLDSKYNKEEMHQPFE